ncbi:MAG: hypothetical protein KDA17_07195 [Candidatus Saccharibacteria bacterium]|nr:hypothetical protein [Candidatus Saccharibacteria bacterium]
MNNWKQVIAVVFVTAVIVTACSGDHDTGTTPEQDQAQAIVNNRDVYNPINDVEGDNYNARQVMADDPTTIIWCSVYPTNPNVKPFTVPVVGKLTSGNKRPYPTEQVMAGGRDGYVPEDWYYPELPGPDGFYGSSGEYRYGFDPAGNYHDFYGLEVYCTSLPNIIQRNTTEILVDVDPDNLAAIQSDVRKAIGACRAINPDPSVPCDAAADALGLESEVEQ